MRRAAKQDISQPAIVAGLRARGYTVEIIGRPVDLLVRHFTWPPNRWALLECKTPGKGGKPPKRKDQAEQAFFCDWHHVPRVTTLEEALGALK